MDINILSKVKLLNPWLATGNYTVLADKHLLPRIQLDQLSLEEWDDVCTVLTGPRQSGKTTLGKLLSYKLLEDEHRFDSLVYLNCDIKEIRSWVANFEFIDDLFKEFSLKKPIIFLDEVQRLENPGLLLKSLVDLKLSIKFIASGSSQLELKSKIKEYLTGRKFEATILPFSRLEADIKIVDWLLYGSYPRVQQSTEKKLRLGELYKDYINKDIIEILKVGKPDVIEKIIILLAHNSGQLVNERQLSIDCKVSNSTIENYINILTNTYVLSKITPFVGNKRTEITSRPKYYFIDNGFRNYALQNFNPLEIRQDAGLLVEGAVYQELLKYIKQHSKDYNLNFWRTKGGSEVDFVISYGKIVIPIEVKYKTYRTLTLSKSFYSFLGAYSPKVAFVINKNLIAQKKVNDCNIHFMPLEHLTQLLACIDKYLGEHS